MWWRCSLLRCLQRRGVWYIQAMRLWRIQQVQTNSAFFKSTALFKWLRMSFVWLWMGPQESKGVYKLVPVTSQIFVLTLAQLFCLSLTSRSQVTLSMVTLLLISQWLRHLFLLRCGDVIRSTDRYVSELGSTWLHTFYWATSSTHPSICALSLLFVFIEGFQLTSLVVIMVFLSTQNMVIRRSILVKQV
jgi:hypothetical protein